MQEEGVSYPECSDGFGLLSRELPACPHGITGYARFDVLAFDRGNGQAGCGCREGRLTTSPTNCSAPLCLYVVVSPSTEHHSRDGETFLSLLETRRSLCCTRIWPLFSFSPRAGSECTLVDHMCRCVVVLFRPYIDPASLSISRQDP